MNRRCNSAELNKKTVCHPDPSADGEGSRQSRDSSSRFGGTRNDTFVIMLHFITGNKDKFAEVASELPNIVQLDIDLPEIQAIDPKEVIRAKLREAVQHASGEFMVEDTSLALDCLNGLPGPLIKWFLKALGNQGVFVLAQKYGDYHATATTMIGYAQSHEEVYFFDGSIRGTIVTPRGEMGYGWDDIFQPDGYAKTFAEMSQKEREPIRMRRIAVEKIKQFLAER